MEVLLTGANRGLGKSLCEEFLKNGDTVYAFARNDIEVNTKYKDKLVVFNVDLQDEKQIDLAFEKLKTYTNNIDVVLNVAGVLMAKDLPVTQNTYNDFLQTFLVNNVAPMYINNRCLPWLKSGKGCIINCCSEIKSIDDVGEWFPAYCCSKTALTQYSYSLAKTLEKDNICVFAVHPGRMITDMGGDNGEIAPEVSAKKIIDIIKNKDYIKNIYIDYNKKAMI